MNVTLNQKHLAALRWVALWADRNGLDVGPGDVIHRSARAIATKIPTEVPWSTSTGRPAGASNVEDGTLHYVADDLAPRFFAVAQTFGGRTPQDGLRIVASLIFDAAPGIALDTAIDDNFAAIDRTFDVVRRRVLGAA